MKIVSLQKNLQNLAGFSEKKAKTYLALLELGESTVADIAQKAELKRTTVYNLLPELRAEGLVSTTKKDGKRRFFVEDPRYIQNHLREKAEMVTTLLPGLQSLHSSGVYKPKISVYEGSGGLRDIYREVVSATPSGGTILSYIGTADFERVLPQEVLDYYVSERISKKIRNRVITLDSQMARTWQKTALNELREIKIIQAPTQSFSGDMKIFGDKVAFISYKENFMGVVIESKEISLLNKSWFEELWKTL